VYPLLLFTINISPLHGVTPELIDMSLGVLSGVPDVITHAIFYADAVCGGSVLDIFNSRFRVGVMHYHWQLLLEKIIR